MTDYEKVLKTKTSVRRAIDKYNKKNYETISIKKKEKIPCTLCDKHISYANMARHVHGCPKRDFNNSISSDNS